MASALSLNLLKEKTNLKHPSLRSEVSLKYGDILKGLSEKQKRISSKYFYDTKGSLLFEKICRLPEYYPTRTEISILKQIASQIMIKNNFDDVIELGSGEALKIKILFNALKSEQRKNTTYFPVDISSSAIEDSKKHLNTTFPEIKVHGIARDFMTHSLTLPENRKRLFCFFGSTIGNLNDLQSVSFLKQIAEQMGNDDLFLLGFDNIKNKNVLEPAYDDDAGITAQFNKNILSVVNNLIKSNFNLSLFEHYAFYNKEKTRVEMHLKAKEDFTVWIDSVEKEISFKKGETIHTENSQKYSIDMIRKIAYKSGLKLTRWHTDPNEWFTVAELKLI